MRKMKMREAMTASPHTIGREQALTVAWDLMRKFNIRHLPVLDGGKLIGHSCRSVTCRCSTASPASIAAR